MEIKRSEINNRIREVFEEARDTPVFISHYNEVTTVLISKKYYDELMKIKEDNEAKEE